MNSQKPWGETFVTSTGEVRVPSAMDFIQVLLDQLLDFMDLTRLEPIIQCEFDCRFEPEFGSPLACCTWMCSRGSSREKK
jgi:hypothetical protein